MHLKQWLQWLVGDGPLPDGSSRTALASVLLLTAAVAAAVTLSLQGAPTPAHTTDGASTSSTSVSATTFAPSTTTASVSTSTSTVASAPVTTTIPPTSTKAAKHHANARSGSRARGRHGAAAATKAAVTPTTSTTAPVLRPAAAPAGVTVAAADPPSDPPSDPPASSIAAAIAAAAAPAASDPPAPTPPGRPTAVRAGIGHDSSRISWSPPASAGSAPVSGYNVYEGTSPGGEVIIPVNGAVPISGHGWTATGLTAGTTYYFSVRAVNAAGLSPPSLEVSSTPTSARQGVGAIAAPVTGEASTPHGTGTGSSTTRVRSRPTARPSTTARPPESN